jgi:hypothetical protein
MNRPYETVPLFPEKPDEKRPGEKTSESRI